MSNLYGKLGENIPDNLVSSTYPPCEVFHVSLRAGQGALKRGTVLARSAAAGDMVILGTAAAGAEVLAANCVLAEDTDATTAVTAQAYRTGHFNRNKVIVLAGHDLSGADEEELRKGGILLSDALS